MLTLLSGEESCILVFIVFVFPYLLQLAIAVDETLLWFLCVVLISFLMFVISEGLIAEVEMLTVGKERKRLFIQH